MYEYDWRDLHLAAEYYEKYGIITVCDGDELMAHEERENEE